MPPLIGISCSFDQKEGRYFLPEAYIEAVIRARGVPVMLPGAGSLKSVGPYLKAIKGLVLAGGGDVDPAHFDEEPQPGLGEITPSRDRFEIMLIKKALRSNIPILGICRGIQILNIACGGTVMQHIPSEIRKPLKHAQSAPRHHPTHKVAIEKSSILYRIVAVPAVRVNSFHHQAVREPAPGFDVTAISNDGVIEAIEHKKYRFVLGVQWHPEGMAAKDRNSRRLFRAFVSASEKSFDGRVKNK